MCSSGCSLTIVRHYRGPALPGDVCRAVARHVGLEPPAAYPSVAGHEEACSVHGVLLGGPTEEMWVSAQVNEGPVGVANLTLAVSFS